LKYFSPSSPGGSTCTDSCPKISIIRISKLHRWSSCEIRRISVRSKRENSIECSTICKTIYGILFEIRAYSSIHILGKFICCASISRNDSLRISGDINTCCSCRDICRIERSEG
jgi:hypothetical protein